MAAPSDVILISYVGYTPKEIKIGSRKVLSIDLNEDAKQLEEVVITAYGTGQKKASMVGSVESIKPAELKVPSTNLSTAFAGRLAGVIAVQKSGQPGADGANFWIRGVSTMNGVTDPLIILDGVQVSSSDLNNLDPEIIDSFSILKDATATAMYGTRGANGVMIVTTKSGMNLDKPIINFRMEAQMSQPTSTPKFVDGATYMELFNEAVNNDNSGDVLYSQDRIDGTRAGLNPYIYPNVNWYDELFKDASYSEKFNFNIRGGGKRVDYFSSISVNHESGMLKNRSKDFFSYNNNIEIMRYNFQNNINAKLSNSSKLSLRLNVQLRDMTTPNQGVGAIFNNAMNTSPVEFPVYFPDDGETPYIKWGATERVNADYQTNPVAQAATGYNKGFQSTVIAALEFNQKLDFITEGLSIAAQFSYDTFNQHTINNSVPTHSTGNLTYPGYSTWMLPEEYSIDEWKNNSAYWIQNGSYVTANQRTTDDAQGNSLSHANPEGTSRFQARLDYARKFGDHNVTAMVLYYMQNKIVGKEVPYRYMGFSGRATYDYKNKYLFEFNIGYNGSENFARGHRFGVFPAGSIGWVVSQEEFMKNVRWIDHLKLRASYGLVGNDQMGSTRFAYLQYYTSGSNMNIYFGEDKKAFGTTLIEGIFANPSLTWEKARKFNFGIDAEFFHQRLTLSVDVFKEHRYDILTSLNTDDKLGFPYIVGQTAPIVNSGIVDNRGIEFQLGWDGRIGQHFRYWIRPNFTFARNKVKFCNEISYIDNNGRDCPWRYQTGRRVGENFCYIFDHFVADQDEADRLNAMNGGSGFAIWGPVQPGDVVYKDMNGDGVVNNYDRAAVGNPRTPEIQYGIPVR